MDFLFSEFSLFLVGSLLMGAMPLIPLGSNAPKKVVLPLMKAKLHPKDADEVEDTNTSV